MNYYKHCNRSQVKAKVYIFDDIKLVAEEEHVFKTIEDMGEWAKHRNAKEQKKGRGIRIVWMQSLTCSGSIHFV